MAAKRSSNQIWRLLLLLELFATILAGSAEEIPFRTGSENDSNLRGDLLAEKRYLAAMAKNGRLPKFSSQKREESLEKSTDDKEIELDSPTDIWVDEKRHIGAFLKSHGKPNFGNRAEERRSAPFDGANYVENPDSDGEKAGKRNVATLARLGRLNAVRFGHFQPQYFGGKKRVNIYNEEMNDGVQVKENNEVTADVDCEEDEDVGKQYNSEDNYVYPTWIQSQQKRYVAALARSGRLPVWHPQRMWWGGKRDTPNAYWLRYRSGARSYGDKRKNNEPSSRFVKLKNKRCKKSSVSEDYNKSSSDEKRNLSMLARKGMLPGRA